MSSGGDRFMGGKETAEGENGRILFNELSLVLIHPIGNNRKFKI